MTKMKKCFLVVLYLAIIVINTAATDEHNITDSKQFERTQYIESKSGLEIVESKLLYGFDERDYIQNFTNETPIFYQDFKFFLPFYGAQYNYAKISLDGFLEFSNRQNDPSFINIFFTKCHLGKVNPEDQLLPGIYFGQEINLDKRKDEKSRQLSNRIMGDIRDGMVGANYFTPRHVIIITWNNVSFDGDLELNKTNTFQLVLATNERDTYAIFNYVNNGENTAQTALIGFNAKNGTDSFEYKPYSQSSNAWEKLTAGDGTNGLPGRHIFRIDDIIEIGTCNDAATEITVSPKSGNMLGGTMVNITGPCFNKIDLIFCKFNDDAVLAQVINQSRAVCIQPTIFVQGYVILELVTMKRRWKTKYFLESPETVEEIISFRPSEVLNKYPQQVTFSWPIISPTKYVQITLWAYEEINELPTLRFIERIADQHLDMGSFTYYTSPHSQSININSSLEFGFIQINVTEPLLTGTTNPSIWSKPIPLAWYFSIKWDLEYSLNWSSQLCKSWIEIERDLPNFQQDVIDCPCHIQQAINDKGRFILDRSWQSSEDCCFRTGFPKGNVADQKCCYAKKDGYLMLSQDQMTASHTVRSHAIGPAPSLSDWVNDIRPYYFCCKWQSIDSNDCRAYRYKYRPSTGCSKYKSPEIAAVFGDPHIIAFDNISYTFNGLGEFVLARINEMNVRLDVQGRFEQVKTTSTELLATELRSVVVLGNSNPVIEVRLSSPERQWREKLDVFVNYERIYFDTLAKQTQHFDGVIVYSPRSSQIVIMFPFDVGVEIQENLGHMTTRIYMSADLKRNVRGLLRISDSYKALYGFYNNQPAGNTSEKLYMEFGMKWLLSNPQEPNLGKSLFKPVAAVLTNYTNFEQYLYQSPQSIPEYNICTSYQCNYDYFITSDKDFALSTDAFYEELRSIQHHQQKEMVACGVLDTPKNGRKSNFDFLLGAIVEFLCDSDFTLNGDAFRYCITGGVWNTGIHQHTECLDNSEYSHFQNIDLLQTIGVWLIVGGVFIFIVIGCCCCRSKMSKTDKRHISYSPLDDNLDLEEFGEIKWDKQS